MHSCVCTPAQLLEHAGHKPGCRFHVAPAPATDLDLAAHAVAQAVAEDAAAVAAAVAPPRPYVAPVLVPIPPGSERYPIAHALALLVRARPFCPAELATEISAYLAPPGSTGDLPDDDDDDSADLPDFPPAAAAPAPLENFRAMPGFHHHQQRLQTGPVMAQPPPPAPSFTPPPRIARAYPSPPYSHGCPHPSTRLQPDGHGLRCLDCDGSFPMPPQARL